MRRVSNKVASQKSEAFTKACRDANCRPTGRQFSKFNNGKGIAFKVKHGKAEPLKEGDPGYLRPPKEE